MRFLHSMLRVNNLDTSLKFFTEILGLKEIKRKEVPKGKFTLVFLEANPGEAQIELTHNWDSNENYTNGRNFGHLAFEVDNIYEFCTHLKEKGIEILRPPRDGYMAFIKSPENISIELLQKGAALEACEPWQSMENKGQW